MFCLEAWAYDIADLLESVTILLLLKYFKIALTSFWDLAGMDKEIQRDSINVCWNMLAGFLIIFVRRQIDSRSEFSCNFPPKQI